MGKIKEDKVEGAEEDGVITTDGIEIRDPLVLRPVDLPLVIKPADGAEWKNENQATYAKLLNGYAYKNPAKWKVKKDDRIVEGRPVKGLITKLKEIGEDPTKLALYAGVDENLSFNNKLIAK